MVARGCQPGVGEFVNIRRVVDTGRVVEVEVVESSARGGGLCAISHAHQVVKIPKVVKPIRFTSTRYSFD